MPNLPPFEASRAKLFEAIGGAIGNARFGVVGGTIGDAGEFTGYYN